jgi:formate hydrogenlyase transcriptional activator
MEKAEPIRLQPNSGRTMGAAAACSFSGCIMPAMASSGQGSERLNAQLLVDSIPGLIHTARPDGYLDYFNKPWLEYLGVTLDKVTGWNWTAFVHPEDVEGIVAKWRACLATGEVFEYETRVRSASGEYRWMFHRKVPLRDANGNIVKWYGSSLDIEERKTAEEQLRRNAEELQRSEFYLAEGQRLANMGSWALDPDGFYYWSPELFRMHGLDPASKPPSVQGYLDCVHPQDRESMADVIKGILVKASPFDATKRIVRPNGEVRYIRCVGVPVVENQSLKKYVGSAIDVTEHELLTRELRRREAYLAEAQRLSHTGSWAWNVRTDALFWSEEIFRIYGYNPQETGPTWEQLLQRVHPEDRPQIEQRAKMEATGKEWIDSYGDFRIVLPDGTIKYVHSVAHPVMQSDEVTEVIGTVMDVTEHELLTQELRRREAYLAEAQKLSHTGSFGWKPDTGEIVWSDETYRIFEYDRSVKPSIDSVVQRVYPEERADFLRVIDRASGGATHFEHAYRLLLPDGRVKHVHALAHIVQDAFGNREFVGAVTDITERKVAEEALRSSEAYLAEAQRLSHTGSWAWSPDTDVRHWSEECYRVLGFDPRDGLPRTEELIQRIHPDDQPAFRESTNRSKHKKSDEEVDYRIVHPGGAVRDIHSIGHPVFSPSGDLIEFTGTVIDITDRKRAEAALRTSEAYLAEAQRLSHTGSWAWSPDDDIRYWSEECYRVLSFDPKDGLPRFEDFFQRIHPDDQPGFRELTQTAIREKAEWEADYRIVHPNGAIRDIHVVGHPVLSTSGYLVEFVGTVIDVTERKRAEGERRRSEMEFRQILDLAPQLVAVYGPNRERLYANRVALDYFGFDLEEWQQSPGRGEYVHPDDTGRLDGVIGHAVARASADELELRLLKRDGTYRWFLARFNPLRDEQGQITRWYATGTDIEDRKQAEDKLRQENVALREEIDKASMFEEIVGTSPALKSVLSRVSKVAPTDSTVLITGETGTGKELVARAIHRRSDRASRAFVSVNCAAIPRDLIASELFGHEKGAFTGATQQRLGRFELANGGTIFLDEVGELPPETQVALLRVLQEHEFERVGGTRRIRADVRVIAATNRDLQAAISSGSFRSDLFYRLYVFPIEIPSLRERSDDIPLLVEYFIDRYARKAGKNIKRVNKKTLELLQSYPWPGNIRELQNVVERSVILCETEIFSIDENWLPQPPPLTPESKQQVELPRRLLVEEKEMIEAALKETGGRVFGPKGAAAKLGIPRSTLESKIRSLKIDKNRFRTSPET